MLSILDVTTKIEAFCKKQLQKTDSTWSVKPRVPAKTCYGTSRKYRLTAEGQSCKALTTYPLDQIINYYLLMRDFAAWSYSVPGLLPQHNITATGRVSGNAVLSLEHQKMNSPETEISCNYPKGTEQLPWFISNIGTGSLQLPNDNSSFVFDKHHFKETRTSRLSV